MSLTLTIDTTTSVFLTPNSEPLLEISRILGEAAKAIEWGTLTGTVEDAHGNVACAWTLQPSDWLAYQLGLGPAVDEPDELANVSSADDDSIGNGFGAGRTAAPAQDVRQCGYVHDEEGDCTYERPTQV